MDINRLIERLKAELGNLVFQLAVKSVELEELKKKHETDDKPPSD